MDEEMEQEYAQMEGMEEEDEMEDGDENLFEKFRSVIEKTEDASKD